MAPPEPRGGEDPPVRLSAPSSLALPNQCLINHGGLTFWSRREPVLGCRPSLEHCRLSVGQV